MNNLTRNLICDADQRSTDPTVRTAAARITVAECEQQGKPFTCKIGLHARGGWVFDDEECRFYYVCIACGALIGKAGQ